MSADDLPTDLDALARYIRDRISMNNYSEAARAARVLAQRLAPDTPVAWTSDAELARLTRGYAASIWGTKHRYSDVDVALFAARRA
jgi:hypothetical protein